MNALILHIEEALRDIVEPSACRETAFYIAEELTGYSRSELLCGKGTTISESTQQRLQEVINQLRKNMPLQYIFGYTEWRGMQLQVSPAVLIPRPETAELVDWILQDTHNSQPTTHSPQPTYILDCGTGSGCIAIALKKARPTWRVAALDVSIDALQIAQANAQAQEVDIQLQQFDLLTEELPTCDIIVSNPPYIRPTEQAAMEKNVLDYEPHTALFVPENDPLLFYRRIAEQKKAKVIYFEINQYLSSEMLNLLHGLGYKTELRNDMYANPRMIRATL